MPLAHRHAVSNAAVMRVNPAVLRWVMDNEGWGVDELAGASGLSPERIREWTAAESYISIRDLKKMSAKFRRPMSVLLMAEAPATTVPRYRRGVGPAAESLPSREVLEVIRKARYVQDNAAELLGAMGRRTEARVHRATLGQNPESAAAESAAALGIEPPRCTGRGEDRDRRRYDEIRKKIESRNVFTMQQIIPEEGPAGFALVDAEPAVVLVNWRDPPRRRIFTILHEYAHVLLNDGIVCHAGGAPTNSTEDSPSPERWCDRFAGAVLMPKDAFRGALRDAHEAAGGDPLGAVAELSDRFCVSKTAALVRATRVLDNARLIALYSRCYGELARDAKRGTRKGEESGNGGAIRMRQDVRCMIQKGRLYANLVATASESGVITTSTALDYLEINLDNFDRLKMRCGGG